MLFIIEFEKGSDPLGVGKPKDNLLPVDRDPSMLVDVTKKVQPRQQMRRWRVRSVARPQTLKDSDCPCWVPPFGLKSLPAVGVVNVGYGELSLLGVGPGEGSERPNSLIQRRAKTVKQVTKNKGEFRRRMVDFKPDDMSSLEEIVLTKNGAGFRLKQNLAISPSLKRIKMYLRPACLEIGIY